MPHEKFERKDYLDGQAGRENNKPPGVTDGGGDSKRKDSGDHKAQGDIKSNKEEFRKELYDKGADATGAKPLKETGVAAAELKKDKKDQ